MVSAFGRGRRCRWWWRIPSVLLNFVCVTGGWPIKASGFIQVRCSWQGHGRSAGRTGRAFVQPERVSHLVGYDVNKSRRIGHAGINIYEGIPTRSVERKSFGLALRGRSFVSWHLTYNGNDWWTTRRGSTASLNWFYEVKGDVCVTRVSPLLELILYCLLLRRSNVGSIITLTVAPCFQAVNLPWGRAGGVAQGTGV